MNKTVLTSALLAASLFAADFSKHSLAELQNLAGTLKPADALDYKLEIRKRIDAMNVKDAKAFMQSVHENTKAAYEKMTREELKKYKAAVREAMNAQIDKMTVKQARELGLWHGHGMHKHAMTKREKEH